jgi:cob(I)alamin adenosyltransferase
MTRIYTRTGDEGETSLYGGQRIPKFKGRIEVVGSLDELNATIGVALSEIVDDDLCKPLRSAQNHLFNIGAEVAEGGNKAKRTIEDSLRVTHADVEQLERWIDGFDAENEPLAAFILPGGCRAGAGLHQARTICRRAERRMAKLGEEEKDINREALKYLNRLSDLLFVMARTVNTRAGVPETFWDKGI